MKSNWQQLTLREAGVALIDCVHATPEAQEDGYPYVGIPQMKSGQIEFETARKITTEDFEKWTQKAYPKQHDVILSRRTNPGVIAVDRTGRDFALGQNLVILRSNGKSVFPPLLRWMCSTPEWWDEINKFMNVGAVFNSLRCADVPKFTLNIPPMRAQESIAEILGALDDKIEANKRMNETLEAMARAVFRDWFVDFGPTRRQMAGASDPVAILGGLIQNPEEAHRLAALFPAALGENGLPEGWKERRVEDDFDVVMGQSPPGNTYNEEGDGLPFFQGRRDFGFRFPEKRVFCNAPKRLSEADWTLVSVRAPVGDINRAAEKCAIGRGVGAFMHKEMLPSLTYYTGLQLKNELDRFDNDGTVFGSINQKQFKSLPTFGADTSIAQKFDDLIKPLDAMIRNNTEESRTLAATRDLLLPKLMSGEVHLKDAEELI